MVLLGAAQIVANSYLEDFITQKSLKMTKDEFLELALSNWEGFKELEKEKDFYTYEKKFDERLVEFGRQLLEKSISDVGEDRRKKKRQVAVMEI